MYYKQRGVDAHLPSLRDGDVLGDVRKELHGGFSDLRPEVGAGREGLDADVHRALRLRPIQAACLQYLYEYIRIHIYVHTYTYIHIYTYMCIYLLLLLYILSYICIHTHIHIYIYIWGACAPFRVQEFDFLVWWLWTGISIDVRCHLCLQQRSCARMSK